MRTSSSVLFILLLLILGSCGPDLPLNLSINTEREFDEDEKISKLMLVVHNRGKITFNNVTVTVSNPKNISELYSFKVAKIVSDEHAKIEGFKNEKGEIYPIAYNDFGLVEITCDEGVWSNEFIVHEVPEAIAEAEPVLFQNVDFDYQLEQETAPAEVMFINKSEHSDSYLWDFGDGKKSEERDPSHTYAKEGRYTVKLTGIQDGKKKVTPKIIVIKKAKVVAPTPKPKPPVKPIPKPKPPVNKITKLRIVKLKIHDFPAKNRNRKNKTWDNALNGKHPDVYYQILSSSGNVFADNRDGRAINLKPGRKKTFYPNYTIKNLNKEYSIRIMDRDDLKNDEFMMGFKFKPSAESYQSPTISYKNAKQHVHIELTVVWE